MENKSKICPICGNELNEDFYCEHCKSVINVYEKIINTSKLLYNQGLQKSKVRDLSGAITVLKRSIKYDKYNMDSRNLLGLVYFEVGEVVLALEQWVISKNIEPDNNIAEYYINQIQQNQHKLDKLNSAIKKYNLALKYIDQKNNDLAVIQLKKVISLNPKFLRAYCLLGLLYIHDTFNEKAKRILSKALSLDKNNYIALKYYESVVESEEELLNEATDDEANEKIVYKGRPKVKTHDKNPLSTGLIYTVFGTIIGVALMYFLIMPNAVNNKQNEVSKLKDQLQTATESYDNQIVELQNENTNLNTNIKEKETLITELEGMQVDLEASQGLYDAVNYYLSDDDIKAANALVSLDANQIHTTSANAVYQLLKEELFPKIAKSSYEKGYRYYQSKQYQEAIDQLTMARKFEKQAYFSDETLYFMARSYQKLGQSQTAINLFTQLLEEYPEATLKRDATNFLNQLSQ